MSKSRKIRLPTLGVALLALLLWAQIVFGVVLSGWRYSLMLFSGWQGYPSGVPAEYDGFIQLANRVLPGGARLVYLAPPGDRYTARFARLHYYLYPRELIWLGLGPRQSPLSRWVPVQLNGGELARLVSDSRAAAVLVDDISGPVPFKGERIEWTASTYILLLKH